jgi:hypothetical protein
MDFDADRLLIGAPGEDGNSPGINGDQSNNALSNAGAAYLFTRGNNGIWRQAAYIKASNPDFENRFGAGIALSGDSAVISAWGEASGATGVNGDQSDTSQPNSGAAYVFELDASGVPAQNAYVKASNTDSNDFFGIAVDLEGNLLAVGATGEDSGAGGIDGDQADNSLVDAGAVYLYERDTAGQWSQIAYVKASIPGAGDGFGNAVALHGTLLIVGATGESSSTTGINGNPFDESAPLSGAVYIFERSQNGAWVQIAYVKASNTDNNDAFGFPIHINGDSLVVGAPNEQSGSSGVNADQSDNSLNFAGAVYLIR